jgi:hypothetical protein
MSEVVDWLIRFWFAGLTGILLESRKMRKVLGAVLGGSSETAEPPSYAFSFNPLPAVVIAVVSGFPTWVKISGD